MSVDLVLKFSTGAVLGFVGSWHCALMCGGLLCALEKVQAKPWPLGVAIYQAGRILCYAALGATAALMGRFIVDSLPLWWLGAGLTIVLGAGLVLYAISRVLMFDAGRRLGVSASSLGWGGAWLKSKVRSRRIHDRFAMGVANGFLPCGLLYAGLAAAATTADPIAGALLLFGLGLGTLPSLLLSRALFGRVLSFAGRALPKIALFATALLGIITILRVFMAGSGHTH